MNSRRIFFFPCFISFVTTVTVSNTPRQSLDGSPGTRRRQGTPHDRHSRHSRHSIGTQDWLFHQSATKQATGQGPNCSLAPNDRSSMYIVLPSTASLFSLLSLVSSIVLSTNEGFPLRFVRAVTLPMNEKTKLERKEEENKEEPRREVALI